MADYYSDMTLEELEAVAEDLRAKRESLKSELKQVVVVIDRRLAEVAARKKLETMSDPERQALFQLLQGNGVESGEVMGTPGR